MNGKMEFEKPSHSVHRSTGLYTRRSSSSLQKLKLIHSMPPSSFVLAVNGPPLGGKHVDTYNCLLLMLLICSCEIDTTGETEGTFGFEVCLDWLVVWTVTTLFTIHTFTSSYDLHDVNEALWPSWTLTNYDLLMVTSIADGLVTHTSYIAHLNQILHLLRLCGNQ